MDKGNSIVTQEDRRAYHAVRSIERSNEPFWAAGEGKWLLSGEADCIPQIQAFAAHRIASTTTAQATIDELRGALEKAERWFAEYAEGHSEKAKLVDADDHAEYEERRYKAHVNEERSEFFRTILARTGDRPMTSVKTLKPVAMHSDVVEVRPCMDASGERRVSWDICYRPEPGATGIGVIASCFGSFEQAQTMAASLAPPEGLAGQIADAIAEAKTLWTMGDKPGPDFDDLKAQHRKTAHCEHVAKHIAKRLTALAARDDVLEEAAKWAEKVGACANTSGRGPCCEALGEDIAEQIRALKGVPQP